MVLQGWLDQVRLAINALFGNIIWLIGGGVGLGRGRVAREGLTFFPAQNMPVYLIFVTLKRPSIRDSLEDVWLFKRLLVFISKRFRAQPEIRLTKFLISDLMVLTDWKTTKFQCLTRFDIFKIKNFWSISYLSKQRFCKSRKSILPKLLLHWIIQRIRNSIWSSILFTKIVLFYHEKSRINMKNINIPEQKAGNERELQKPPLVFWSFSWTYLFWCGFSEK